MSEQIRNKMTVEELEELVHTMWRSQTTCAKLFFELADMADELYAENQKLKEQLKRYQS